MMGTLNKYSGALGIFYACLHIYELTLGMYAHARKTHTCLHIQSTLKYAQWLPRSSEFISTGDLSILESM